MSKSHPLSDRTYSVSEPWDSRVLHCRSEPLQCQSAHTQCWSIVTLDYTVEAQDPLSECTYIMPERITKCRSAHTQCRSAMLPYSTVAVHLHRAEAHTYCQSQYRQCRSVVTPECCTTGAHLHSVVVHHLMTERSYTVQEQFTQDCTAGAHLYSVRVHVPLQECT
ncbi:hypothetical protein AMTR_s00117p00085690 [Amborella trichopoda]|uniref:Uncharacterized protein n=1 Tax=Amborella trichopoda TaxID=13333 RepID=W1NR23_AMBTC|nr:hypothetical protein AMTR_s00117p00085690 [Amborella trichopoda]